MALNRIILPALLLFLSRALPAQLSVAEARDLAPGTTVTVRGTVTSGAELGKIRYLQDATAGIAAFPGSGSAPGFEQAVGVGDSVEITGTLTVFNGLLEITPVTAYQVLASGVPLPVPTPVTLAMLAADDALEGQLVRIDCASFTDGGQTSFAGGGLYPLVDAAGDAVPVYVRTSHPLIGAAVPVGPLTVWAIVSDYNGRQLLLRSAADWAPSTACFRVVGRPEQSDIQTDGFQLDWLTTQPATSWLRVLNADGQLLQQIAVPGSGPANGHALTGLAPGTVYWVQVAAVNVAGDSAFSAVRPYATRSLSSGEIRIYFNQDIDPAAAAGLAPAGQSYAAVLGAITDRINAAESTIDVAMFSNSNDEITNALKAARARGVRVRYIAAFNANSFALDPPPLFPVLYGNYNSLMHNKFMVIDADLADKAWAMNGSMNWTTGMINDFNNAVFIQDQSLARAYELEFEEMWGATGAQPDAAAARFGTDKTDNTPHRFVVGNRAVELYFSPSDGTTHAIEAALATADTRVDAALYVFTHDGPGAVLVDRFGDGVAVRAMTENFADFNSELIYLGAQGIAVQEHTANGILHHKYAVVDAGAGPATDPLVVTGSHNWTYTAESANDENTLILHDADVAQLFFAEFEERWQELTSVHGHAGAAPGWRLTPNPAGDWITVQMPGDPAALPPRRLELFNASGQLTRRLYDTAHIDLRGLAAGFYIVLVQTADGTTAVPLQKI